MDALGINIWQILFYLVSFIIALLVLDKFVFQKVSTYLTEREDAIAKALAEKDELEKQKSNADEEIENLIQAAKQQAREILDAARGEAEPEKERIIQAAVEYGERVVAEAQTKATQILQDASSKAQQESIVIIKDISKKSLAHLNLSKEVSDQVFAEIINKL